VRGFLSFLLDCIVPRSCLVCERGIGPFDPASDAAASGMSGRMAEFADAGVRMALFRGVTLSADVLCAACWSRLGIAPGAGSIARLSAGAERMPVVSPFHTNDELLALVRFLKFSGGRSAAPALGWWMAAALGDYRESRPEGSAFDPLLVPVPLHPKRERSRGYNQSALLAREVAGRLGLEVDVRVLARVRDTKAQSTLDREARSENVRGAFDLVGGASAAGRDIVLVDDLLTTGETARACAGALDAASPRSIAVLAAGRARD
jgi:ComF family protein